MGEIRMFPVAPTSAGADHIIDLLTAAAADGRDLGSRVPNMRQNACALARLAQTLDEEVRALYRDLEANSIGSAEDLAALATLDRLVCDVRKLFEIADTLLTER
ncbi:hypothetical protein ADL19_05720 [Streptomyces purpurogeneiscleroticus]|nr:hypothetical protein ADL19_05720 [Streptomyces purpurogeneiscleroticus]